MNLFKWMCLTVMAVLCTSVSFAASSPLVKTPASSVIYTNLVDGLFAPSLQQLSLLQTFPALSSKGQIQISYTQDKIAYGDVEKRDTQGFFDYTLMMSNTGTQAIEMHIDMNGVMHESRSDMSKTTDTASGSMDIKMINQKMMVRINNYAVQSANLSIEEIAQMEKYRSKIIGQWIVIDNSMYNFSNFNEQLGTNTIQSTQLLKVLHDQLLQYPILQPTSKKSPTVTLNKKNFTKVMTAVMREMVRSDLFADEKLQQLESSMTTLLKPLTMQWKLTIQNNQPTLLITQLGKKKDWSAKGFLQPNQFALDAKDNTDTFSIKWSSTDNTRNITAYLTSKYSDPTMIRYHSSSDGITPTWSSYRNHVTMSIFFEKNTSFDIRYDDVVSRLDQFIPTLPTTTIPLSEFMSSFSPSTDEVY